MTTSLSVGTTQLGYEQHSSSSVATAARAAVPFVFQHGMGGNTAQPLGYVGDQPPTPVVCLAARGHVPSDDLTADTASFDVFADDVIALADHLGLDRFPVGGISLGAGTALNLAVRHPDRVSALVLCRPAWLDRPQAELNQAGYREIADILDTLLADGLADDPSSAAEAADRYRDESRIYRAVERSSPAAAASLAGQITRPRAAHNGVLLRSFPATSPTRSTEPWRRLDVPTLVIGHHDDPFHPYPIAQAYAEAIPAAQLCTVPSKDADPDGFTQQIRSALHTFIALHSFIVEAETL